MNSIPRISPASILRCRQGVALIEFALTLPILILLFLGAVELTRFAILHQKLDKAAGAMADFVTQANSISDSDLDAFADAVAQIMGPFGYSGTVVFSSVLVTNTPIAPCTGSNAACISWQRAKLGGDASKIGSEGGNAILPSGFDLQDGQNIIVAEVYFDYDPLLPATGALIPALTAQKLYKVAVYKPRLGLLTQLD